MAKRRKVKKSFSRRKKVSGVNKQLLTNVLFAAVGGVAAKALNKLIGNVSITSNSSTDSQIKAALPIVGGVAVSAFLGKKDAKFMYLGLGMAAVGAANLATSMGVLSGVPMLAGSTMPRRLNGVGQATARKQSPLVAGVSASQAALMS